MSMKVRRTELPAVVPASSAGVVASVPAAAPVSAAAPPLAPRRGAVPLAVGSSRAATTPQLVGRARAELEPTPAFNLYDAVARADFAARDPAEIVPPAPLLDAIKSARRILVIGHVGPDADCVGSALAIARGLEALRPAGTGAPDWQVDVCIDDDLNGRLRRLDSGGDVKRAAELGGGQWDLAIVVDVAAPTRIGGAAQLLKQAARVAVVDHHVVDPEPKQFGVDAQRFVRWIEPDFPSSSLQVAAVLARLSGELRVCAADPESVYMPILAGFATDTGWGLVQGADRNYFRYFKHVLVESAHTSMEALSASLDAYQLPASVARLLEGERVDPSSLPPSIAAELDEQAARGRGLQRLELPGASGAGAGLGLVSCDAEHLATLLRLGQRDDPRMLPADFVVPMQVAHLQPMQLAKVPLGALLVEQPDGSVQVSLRSPDARARRLAEHLGGGGHDGIAAARVRGESLEQLRERIVAWARDDGVVV